jgi:hypothetical protein
MGRDQRQRTIDESGSALRLTNEVLDYMEAQGDAHLLFAATVLTLAVPSNLQSQRGHLETNAGVSPTGVARRSAVVACNLLARDTEAVMAVGVRSIYLLPAERIPIDDVVEFVLHYHCSAAFPAIEIRVGTPAGTSEVRVVAMPSEYMLRQAVAVLQTACPFARIVFHSHTWLPKRPAPGLNGSSRADDLDDYDDGSTRPSMTHIASDAAKAKLASYRRQKTGQPDLARVAAFGPGRYSEAADALTGDLERMLKEVERMIEVTGPPQPIAAPSAAAPATRATPQVIDSSVPATSAPSTPSHKRPRHVTIQATRVRL